MPTVWELFDLTGQVAIVTGGAGRLGSQMCDALAEAGAHVVVASRDLQRCRQKAAALSEHYAEAMAVAVDVTDPESVRAMREAVLARFGRIDILVNNAYSGLHRPFEEMTREEFESALRGGLTSAFLCAQAVSAVMKDAERGVIINIASIYGVVSPDHRIYGRTGLNSPCNYGAAKAGLIQLTRWLATYLAPYGIRVNCITPGGFYDERLRTREDYEQVFVPNYIARTPLGRMGGPTDLKGVIVFLASSASAYITGQNIIVDGGWTVW